MLKHIMTISGILVVAACSDSGNSTPAGQAAAACEAEAIVRIGEKTYQLDTAALAASGKLTEGEWAMQAPITISPGLRDEAKQLLECRVRLSDGKPPEIISINFVF
jgi:hypothetical protein